LSFVFPNLWSFKTINNVSLWPYYEINNEIDLNKVKANLKEGLYLNLVFQKQVTLIYIGKVCRTFFMRNM